MIISYQSAEPKMASDVFIAENASVIGHCDLASKVSIWYGAVLRADIAPIIVGEGSNIQDNSVCHVDYDKPVVIGKNVTIGHSVTLHACTINDGALIGMGSVVLDVAIVEEGALVGAGSVVSPNTVVRKNSLYLGNPAREKRLLSKEEIDKILTNAKVYQELLLKHLK